MAQSGLNEWLQMDEQNMKFHMGQYETPYRSTVKFLEYLKTQVKKPDNRICDLGCGAGAALAYCLEEGKEFLKEGIGIDIAEEVVKIGNSILKQRQILNCELFLGDIFDLNRSTLGAIDGIISLQVFNILPDYRKMAKCMCQLDPDWIAFSTLGFEGLIDYNIKLADYTKKKDGNCAEVFYNIYSLPIMKEFFAELGYKEFNYKKFEMDIDLPKTNLMGRGTYTIKTEDGERLQISGGMMMPWYFVYVSR